MIRIYTADTLAIVEYLRSVLAGQRIETLVRNQYVSGAIGELPVFDCSPELWLIDETQLERAQALLRELLTPADGTARRCPACQESIEPQFGQCWQCGTLFQAGNE